MTAFAKSLHRSHQTFSRLFAKKMNGHAITLTQFIVLDALQRRGLPTMQTRLVDLTHIDRSTLSEMISRMSVGGLVTCHVCSRDNRATEVSITPAGRRLLTKARNAMARAEKSFAASASATDLRAAVP